MNDWKLKAEVVISIKNKEDIFKTLPLDENIIVGNYKFVTYTDGDYVTFSTFNATSDIPLLKLEINEEYTTEGSKIHYFLEAFTGNGVDIEELNPENINEETRFQYMINYGLDIDKVKYMTYQQILDEFVRKLYGRTKNEKP